MRVGTVAAVGLAAVVAIGLGACGGDDDDDAASSATTIAVADGLRPFPTDVAPLPAAGEDPADGVHAVQIASADADGTTITVDFMEFLTGEAANEAYDEDTGSSEPVPDDYWIRDDAEDPVTLVLADDVAITLVEADDAGAMSTVDATIDEVPGEFGGPDSPYWITVEDGAVTRIDQQFVP